MNSNGESKEILKNGVERRKDRWVFIAVDTEELKFTDTRKTGRWRVRVVEAHPSALFVMVIY